MDLPALPILLFFVAAVVIGVIAYNVHLQQKRRREELSGLAEHLRWRFIPDRDGSHDEQYAHFEIFRRGHSRYAYNTLIGQMEIGGRMYAVKMGDFRYRVTSGSGKNRRTRTYCFSYVILHIPLQELPPLLIRPEGVFDKLAGALGFGDIGFESAEFNRRFFVNSSDKRFAYDMLHPQMMQFLMDTDPPEIDMQHARCCLSDGSRTWSASEFKQRLDWSQQFFQLWPRHLVRELELRR